MPWTEAGGWGVDAPVWQYFPLGAGVLRWYGPGR